MKQKRKGTKRLFSIVLTLAMILTSMSLPSNGKMVSAEAGTPDYLTFTALEDNAIIDFKC
ncbi:MAG: hypothetical protein II374_06270 [Lachnospiraceae bacterium]|nr:hypothetical protein [Lachnospiraceae bacterium]MBQ2320931.1 hypothetical protein [Lachnospiraceae bacterium]